MSRFIVLSAIILVFSPYLAWADSCTNFNSNMGATFDLTELVRAPEQPPYMVEDGDIPCTTNKVEQNYTYVFNVCGAVSGNVPMGCKSVNGYSSAGALQIDRRGTSSPDDDWCYLVGTYGQATTKVNLLSAEDPTKGLAVTYYGQYCVSGTQRRFNIDLICADKLSPIPTHALELEPCVYSVTMPSVYGCPLECPVANRHLCGGNGHCAYDEDKRGARCFCNRGFGGADCTSTSSSSSSNYSPALLGLIITLFIIVVLLAGSIVFMVRQMDAYKEDLANYQTLKGSEDESAVV